MFFKSMKIKLNAMTKYVVTSYRILSNFTVDVKQVLNDIPNRSEFSSLQYDVEVMNNKLDAIKGMLDKPKCCKTKVKAKKKRK